MFRLLHRRLNHCVNRRITRRITRGSIKGSPEILGHALMSFRRAIRARRRLMKLAPDRFDAAVVDRLARKNAEEEIRENEIRKMIARVYGVDESAIPPPPVHEPRKRGARTEAAIARELDAAECWLAAGREALKEYRRQRPHEIPSLSRIAQLLALASRLGRLSTGLETTQKEEPPPLEPQVSFQEALQRVYGDQADPVAPAV